MLLAEIHGKHMEVVESNEDYLTSAVFGHLRLLADNKFWEALLQSLRSLDGRGVSLRDELVAAGVTLEFSLPPKILFWPWTKYGQPDLLLHFRSASGRPLVLVIEVKLYAEKSSTGENDQLCKYFNLLHDDQELERLFGMEFSAPEVALIYLTERFCAADVLESVSLSKHSDAASRMFPLQWQDMTSLIRKLNPKEDSPLDEVRRFLERRNYDHFRGFQPHPLNMRPPANGFYSITYFEETAGYLQLLGTTPRRFYGN